MYLSVVIGIYMSMATVMLVYCLIYTSRKLINNVQGIVVPIILWLEILVNVFIILFWCVDPFGMYGVFSPVAITMTGTGWIAFLYGSDVYYLFFWITTLSKVNILKNRNEQLMRSIAPLAIIIVVLGILQILLTFLHKYEYLLITLSTVFFIISVVIFVLSIKVMHFILKFLQEQKSMTSNSDVRVKVKKALKIIALKSIVILFFIVFSVTMAMGLGNTPIYPFLFIPIGLIMCFRVGLSIYLFLPVAIDGIHFMRTFSPKNVEETSLSP
eukprot:TRINITY_DN732_c0_g1_i1.p1 TRINITY_DN732_c0_g1~~TRINITY_DN732_c0_g1_i1.p1  ORF type:complete len:270 (-),score=11.44 TRINITY_DN732_c0_g1_i1:13-822(-)